MVRRILIISLLMIFVAAGYAMASSKATEEAPKKPAPKKSTAEPITSKYKGKMELSDDVFDFGYLPKQSKVSHTFWLKNIGLDTLEVINIKPG